jgi:predicted transcriptional regulator
MPNTSVHLPQSLLAGLDRIAAERGLSRNRLIVESCRRIVEERACWPAGLFSNDHLSEADMKELRRSEPDFREAVEGARKSRTRPPI